MKPEAITLNCADGQPLAAKVFKANPAQAAAVIAPALGVPSRFYASYAQYLADHGFSVLTFDYRGSGESVAGSVRGRDVRMEDWGRLDIDAALAWVQRELKPKKLFLVGHSAGGQLPGLAAMSEKLDGMVFVAASAPHLRHYPLRSWPKLGLTLYLAGPLLSLGRDQFPAKQTGLGSTTVAAGVVAQWSRWARSRNYLFDAAHGIDTARYAKLNMPI
ncbi:MAG: alpha/beta hydrolase family protein, partial [Nevskiales bacterium]